MDPIPPGFAPATHGGPYAEALGPFFSRRGAGEVTLAARVERRHCNSGRVAHGGFVATLADLGLIHAVALAREAAGLPREPLATVSLDVDYIGPAPEGAWLEVRCAVLKLGRLAFAEGAMLAGERRVARVAGVFTALEPRG